MLYGMLVCLMVFTCLLCVSLSQWDVSPKESTITLVFNTDKSTKVSCEIYQPTAEKRSQSTKNVS